MKSEAEFTLGEEGLLEIGSERTFWIGKIPNSRIPKIIKTIKEFFLKVATVSFDLSFCFLYKVLETEVLVVVSIFI